MNNGYETVLIALSVLALLLYIVIGVLLYMIYFSVKNFVQGFLDGMEEQLFRSRRRLDILKPAKFDRDQATLDTASEFANGRG